MSQENDGSAVLLKPRTFSSGAAVLAPSRFQSGNNPWKSQASENDTPTEQNPRKITRWNAEIKFSCITRVTEKF